MRVDCSTKSIEQNDFSVDASEDPTEEAFDEPHEPNSFAFAFAVLQLRAWERNKELRLLLNNVNTSFTFVVGELLPVTSPPLVTPDSWHLFRSDSRRSPLLNADSTISDSPATLRPDRASIELNYIFSVKQTKSWNRSIYTHWPIISFNVIIFSPHYVIGWHGEYFFILQIINDEQTGVGANADNAPVWVQWDGAHIRLAVPVLRVNNQTRREVRAACRSLAQSKTGTQLVVVVLEARVVVKRGFNVALDRGWHGDDAICCLIVIDAVHDDDSGGGRDDKGATKEEF